MHRYSFIIALLFASCMSPADHTSLFEQGVSWELAQHRAVSLSDIQYDVHLRIPDAINEPITGAITLHFLLSEGGSPVVVDFNQPLSSVRSVQIAGEDVPYEMVNNHIVLSSLEPGRHAVEVAFVAGESSLNRNDEYLYTLFVPDRASFAIPLFDQPNLKARYRLTLDTPSSWTAVANGSLEAKTESDGSTTYRFAETKPISTYLFSFAAGIFQTETTERDGRRMTLYHRETDADKVARNSDVVFDLHYTALEWLEDYTDIDYPFDKFDFVLIPSFQYGGMEHPGAILYRASSLFLDESATQNQYLGRASLIAHETAHMWFGDLVTMNWFDDVWTKEVFANFMAAKIANPTFPNINHNLRFLLRHYPSAYEVDRTAGANPIRQPLENLQMAGTLYGAIIYQKAPIVMRQLEYLIGEDMMQEGLRVYLDRYQFANATWNDLIDILDTLSPEDLSAWSTVWIDEPGRPRIETILANDPEGSIVQLSLYQTDPLGLDRTWNQHLTVTLGYPDSVLHVPVYLNASSVDIDRVAGQPMPDYVLPHGMGMGYGHFVLDQRSQDYLLQHLPGIPDVLQRGVAWTALWDAVLNESASPTAFIDLCVQALATETDALNIQRALNYLTTAYWRFLPEFDRIRYAPVVETTLWDAMQRAESISLKKAYFNAYTSVVRTESGIANLFAVWDTSQPVAGLTFSERDYTSIALELAVRDTERAEATLDAQYERITNPDRRARFAFIRPAVSPDPVERDAFFASLSDLENRSHEPWVLTAMRYLHHPLRAGASVPYIHPGLELLEEIQRTGDIFFPQRWLAAMLDGHQSDEAAETVRAFIEERPEYPFRLKNKILQSADGLYRAAGIVGE